MAVSGQPALVCIVCQRRVLETPGLYWTAMNRWILGVGVARSRREARIDIDTRKDVYAWKGKDDADGTSGVAVCVPHCAATFLEMQCREWEQELDRRCDDLERGADSQ